jgi:hypothetical protein
VSRKHQVKLFDQSDKFLRYITKGDAEKMLFDGQAHEYYCDDDGHPQFLGIRLNSQPESRKSTRESWPTKQFSRVPIVRNGEIVGEFTVRIATKQFIGPQQ